MKRFASVALCCLLFGVSACGGDDGDEEALPEVDCDAEVPTHAEVEVFHPAGNLCVQCHSSTLSGTARNGAPSAINVDVYESAAMFAELIVEQVSSGAMPPPDEGYSISEEQKQQVYQWGLCGAPQ